MSRIVMLCHAKKSRIMIRFFSSSLGTAFRRVFLHTDASVDRVELFEGKRRDRCTIDKIREEGRVAKRRALRCIRGEGGSYRGDAKMKDCRSAFLSVFLTAVVLSLRVSCSQQLQNFHFDPCLHRERSFAFDDLRKDLKEKKTARVNR